MNFFIVFWLGWLVSFLGQLPVGTISITATQIGVAEGMRNAWKYTFGVVVIELAYVRLTLSVLGWIASHQLFFTIANWVTVVIFIGLGVATIIHAVRLKGEQKALLLNNKLDRFLLGLTMSGLNPAQIPFWFIWSSYLISVHVLGMGFGEFNSFSAGAALGTVGGLAAYIYGGKWLVAKLKASTKMLNIIMGAIFIIAAVAQLYRILS